LPVLCRVANVAFFWFFNVGATDKELKRELNEKVNKSEFQLDTSFRNNCIRNIELKIIDIDKKTDRILRKLDK
jgi:hypothetical protein